MFTENWPTKHRSGEILSVEDVKRCLRTADPDYGRNFSEAEWQAICGRLEALARLLYRMARRSN